MHEHKNLVPIWFFIGVLLTIYGVLIMGAGLYELKVPPVQPVVYSELHAGIWWGAILLVMGLFYTVRFYPKKGN